MLAGGGGGCPLCTVTVGRGPLPLSAPTERLLRVHLRVHRGLQLMGVCQCRLVGVTSAPLRHVSLGEEGGGGGYGTQCAACSVTL